MLGRWNDVISDWQSVAEAYSLPAVAEHLGKARLIDNVRL
jgi:pantothenate synthetase